MDHHHKYEQLERGANPHHADHRLTVYWPHGKVSTDLLIWGIPMQAENAYVRLKVGDFEEMFCTYEHWLQDKDFKEDAKLMYVGCCKLREVWLFPDARRNNEWQRHFVQDALVTVRIVLTSKRLVDCQNAMTKIFREQQPICNVKGYRTTGQTMVTCNETGEQFPSILAAARAKGLSQSQLTNHVNNRAGFRTVKGLTFRRGFIQG